MILFGSLDMNKRLPPIQNRTSAIPRDGNRARCSPINGRRLNYSEMCFCTVNFKVIMGAVAASSIIVAGLLLASLVKEVFLEERKDNK